MHRYLLAAALAAAFVAGFVARGTGPELEAQGGPRVYELRTYTAPDGQLDRLHARFRNDTLRIFEKHGMENVIYLAPTDDPLAANTLVYLIAHASRAAAEASWDAFRSDPEWQAVRDASRVEGPLVSNVESVFLTTTDYSPMR